MNIAFSLVRKFPSGALGMYCGRGYIRRDHEANEATEMRSAGLAVRTGYSDRLKAFGGGQSRNVELTNPDALMGM